MNTKAQQQHLKKGLKRGRLRAIDSGTVYDIAGNLMRIGREIRRGEFGHVSEAVVVLKGEHGIELRSLGRGDMDAVYRMTMSAARRAEGNPVRGIKITHGGFEEPA